MKRRKLSDETAAFEKALAAEPSSGRHVLRLYVTGATPKSLQAIQNIRELCEEKLHGRYDLQVIDIRQHPELAKPEQLVAAPTLVKKLPLPVRKLIGDLSSKERVLAGLDLMPVQASKHSDGD